MTNLAVLRIEYWPIERLVDYPRNLRRNDAAVEQMGASILESGFAIPVLARSSGEVIGGLLRLKTARKMGSWPSGNPVQNHTQGGHSIQLPWNPRHGCPARKGSHG